MEFKYQPIDLITIRKEIENKHPIKREVSVQLGDEDLRRLILRLVSLSSQQIDAYSASLTKKETLLIAGYIPHNFYNVKMQNLFSIFRNRENSELCETMYVSWQSSFINRECNIFISSLLNDTTCGFADYISKYHFSKSEFDNLVKAINPAIELGFLLKDVKDKKRNFAEKMEYFGVRKGSRLYSDCEYLFYTYCSKDDYLSRHSDELISSVRRYTFSDLQSFMKNLLTEMNLVDLEKMSYLLGHIYKYVNEIDSDRFKAFFANFEKSLIDKYINWINISKLNSLFGNDDRSKFWKNYAFKKVVHFKENDSVVMYFDKYVAIEFLGETLGPIYIYQKDYFENSIYVQFRYGHKSNSAMRTFLYKETDYRTHGFRYEHRGYWQREVHSCLIRNNMTIRLHW